jgi:hypothetical protein
MFVELGSQAAHLALGDAANAQCLDQVVNRARGDALHIGLLDDSAQRLLRGASRSQKLRKVATLMQLGDLLSHRAGTGVPLPISVSIADVDAVVTPLFLADAAAGSCAMTCSLTWASPC